MIAYFKKVISVIRDVRRKQRELGFGAALNFLRRKLWIRSCVVFYSKEPDRAPIKIPDGLRVAVTSRLTPVVPAADIAAAGAGDDVKYLSRGATCYLLYRLEEPVAVGWLFESSRLLKRAGLESGSIYVGGFFVRESERGQGLYPLLLRIMSRDISAGMCRTLADTTPGNRSSQRGLEKAGFKRLGELRTVVVCGVIVACRFSPFSMSQGTEKLNDR